MQPLKPNAAPDWRSFNDHVNNLDSPNRTAEPTTPSPQGKFFNRELSWIRFNERVLSEAGDPTVPALERLRFAAIVSSNLDEFFMVRVAEVSRMAKIRRGRGTEANMPPHRIMTQIRDLVLRQKSRQAEIVRELFGTLAQEGLQIYSEFPENPDLDREIRAVLPPLKFIIRRHTEPLPWLDSDRINVFVRFPDASAIVTFEDRGARLASLPSEKAALRYVLLERWISARARQLFPDRTVIESFPFKIIRDADLRYRPDDEESLEEQIVQAVQQRTRARVVRLEVDAPNYSEGAMFLATSLRVDSASLYRFDLPLDLRTLATLYNLESFQHLKYPPVQPVIPPFLIGENIFDAIRARDILLHHPYDSFDVIVDFLKAAAVDPDVTHIRHTLYRTSHESPIVEALKEAARRGKKVTVYIEIKARFDELNNVRMAEELRKAGARVARPSAGYKVHSKLTQILRKEGDKTVSYLHLGTGNYHPGTAKQYTDIGLLTADESLGHEITTFFKAMANRQTKMDSKEILAAPANLQPGFLKLIREETDVQKRGGKGHIIAKMNSLVDPGIIEALYQASQAGVKITLLVRGICCLRPGVKGLSETIKVKSVVDRFLEHSRIYYFRADGAKKVFLSSADWMPRNFYARYELAFPIKDPVLKKYLREVVLATSSSDNERGWILKSDGNYERVVRGPHAKPIRSQFLFEEMAKNRYKGTILDSRP